MVKFRISLNLHNFNNLSEKKYSKLKANKILKFYKAIGKLIKKTHNYDVKRTQKQFKEYCEPLIKIRKNIFTETVAEEGNPLAALIGTICPPSIDIDIEFAMTSQREEIALKQFYKDYKGSVTKSSYKELRTLYYSTKIIQFVNRLRGLINDNVLWLRYVNRQDLKTKYKPDISVSDAAVLSLT
jgi:hypothetical protein